MGLREAMKIQAIRFSQNKKIRVLLLVLLVAFLLVSAFDLRYYWQANGQDPIPPDFFRLPLQISPILFLVFLTLAISFFYESRNIGLHETIVTTARGKGRDFFSGYLALIAWLCLFSLLIVAINVTTAIHIHLTDRSYLRYLIGITFWFAALLPAMGVLYGFAVTELFRRDTIWIALVVLAYLFSFAGEQLLVLLLPVSASDSPFLAKTFALFRIFLPDKKNSYFPDQLYPVLTEECLKLTIHLCLILWLLSMLWTRQKVIARWIAPVLSLLCTVLLFSWYTTDFSLLPYSQQAYAQDALFYREQDRALSKQEPMREEETADAAGLKIQCIEGSLSLTANLHARLTYHIKFPIKAAPLQDFLTFTLYHGYRLQEAQLDGSPVTFVQEGDTILLPTGKLSRKRAGDFTVSFQYQGQSPRYFANTEACCLPGFFPYMPRLGKQVVFEPEQTDFVSLPFPDDVEFALEISPAKGLFTNLTLTPAGLFHGRSNGVSLFKGWYREAQEGQITIVYPYLYLQREEQVQDFFDLLRRVHLTEQADNPASSVVFYVHTIVSQSPELRAADFSDHWLLSGPLPDLEERISLKQILPEKRDLKKHLNLMNSDFATFLQFAERYQTELAGLSDQDIRQQGKAKQEQLLKLSKLCQRQSFSFINDKLGKYLFDASDDRSAESFLDTLLQEPADSVVSQFTVTANKAELYQIVAQGEVQDSFFEKARSRYKKLNTELHSLFVSQEVKQAHRRLLASDCTILYWQASESIGQEALYEAALAYLKDTQDERDSGEFLRSFITSEAR